MRSLTLAIVTLVFVALPTATHAEMARFRYVPIDNCGRTGQIPIGPEGSMGELYRGLGLRAQAYPQPLRTTHTVTFRHSNGRNIIVPLAFPQGTPRMETRTDKIIYHFDSYEIEVQFFGDGSVDVVYNSGVLRPLNLP